MMMKKYVDFVPRSDAAFLAWLQVYRANFPRLAEEIRLSELNEEQIAQHLQEVDEMIQVLLEVEQQKLQLAAIVAKKNSLRKKVTRSIRNMAFFAKKSLNPAMGIITGLRLVSVGQAVDTRLAAPAVKANVSAQGVHIAFEKQRFYCVAIFSRYPGEHDWTFLSNCLYTPYIDDRPLRVPGQPERREYMAMYSNGAKTIGQKSVILSIVYGG